MFHLLFWLVGKEVYQSQHYTQRKLFPILKYQTFAVESDCPDLDKPLSKFTSLSQLVFLIDSQ